jgi:hypothetical protein
MLKFTFYTSLLLAIYHFFSLIYAISNPEEYVHPLAGTFTEGDKFSTGNTLPLIGCEYKEFFGLFTFMNFFLKRRKTVGFQPLVTANEGSKSIHWLLVVSWK